MGLGARFAQRIVDSLFVRATDDPVRHDHRARAMLFQEFRYLDPDPRIIANLALAEPAPQRVRLRVRSGQDADSALLARWLTGP